MTVSPTANLADLEDCVLHVVGRIHAGPRGKRLDLPFNRAHQPGHLKTPAMRCEHLLNKCSCVLKMSARRPWRCPLTHHRELRLVNPIIIITITITITQVPYPAARRSWCRCRC